MIEDKQRIKELEKECEEMKGWAKLNKIVASELEDENESLKAKLEVYVCKTIGMK